MALSGRDTRLDAGSLNLLDPRAFGVALGSVAAASVVVSTVLLVVRGGEIIGPNLGLLSQYLVGYTVSWPGALLGGTYAFGVGFLLGYVFARARNRLVQGYLRHLCRRGERDEVSDLLDHLS